MGVGAGVGASATPVSLLGAALVAEDASYAWHTCNVLHGRVRPIRDGKLAHTVSAGEVEDFHSRIFVWKGW